MKCISLSVTILLVGIGLLVNVTAGVPSECFTACPLNLRPVCGSDGVTYGMCYTI